jgi:hypothetical protein
VPVDGAGSAERVASSDPLREQMSSPQRDDRHEDE